MTTVSYPDLLDEIIDLLDVQPTLPAYALALAMLNSEIERSWDRGYEAGREDRE